MNKLFKVLLGGAVVCALVSCGGGGDVAGDQEDFLVTPNELKISVPSDASNPGCSNAAKAKPAVFTIVGGQPPFRLINSHPQAIIVDKTEATGKDPRFTITFQKTEWCFNPATITVLDYHSRMAVVEIITEVSAAE